MTTAGSSVNDCGETDSFKINNHSSTMKEGETLYSELQCPQEMCAFISEIWGIVMLKICKTLNQLLFFVFR